MSVISGTLGAILGSRAQRAQAEANLRAARETNEMNYRMFNEGRGATGHAFLPTYFGGKEQQLAQDAMLNYDQMRAMMGSPEEQLRSYQAAMDQYQPMADAARGTLADVYNGNMTTARLAYLDPVLQARTAQARGQQSAIGQGLAQTQNALAAANARKGFTGTGSFANNRLLAATTGARQAASGVLGAANLANAQDTRGVYDQGMETRLKLMDQPFQMAQGALNMKMQPMNQVQSNFSRSLQPFEFFKMGPQGFKADALPQTPFTGSAAQMALTGMGAANQQVGSFFANQAAANAAKNAAWDWDGAMAMV